MRLPQRILTIFAVTGFISSLFASVATAQIQVNEFLADSNASSSAVISDANGEWVEITNTGNSVVDLSNWTIETGLVADTTPTIDTFPLNTTIDAGKSLVICDNDNPGQNGGVMCDLDLSISLTNNDGKIVLKDNSSVKIDEVTYYSANSTNAKPSTDDKDIEEGSSANVSRNESGEQTGTTNETTETFGPSSDPTDADSPAQYGSPSSNTVYNQNNPNHAYATLQEAINDATSGDTILVNGDQVLADDVTVDKSVTITTDIACAITVNGVIAVEADQVTISNLTLINPAGDVAIKVESSDVTLKDNCIKNIGSDDALGSIAGIVIDGSIAIPNGVKILNNTISNVVSDDFDASAILVASATNLTITGNSVDKITASNTATAIDLQNDTEGVLIKNNNISNITGRDNATGILLVGNTPNTLIESNTISSLTANEEAIGIFNRQGINDDDITTITLRLNIFKDLTIGVQNNAEPKAENRLSAQLNFWGSNAGPIDHTADDASLPTTNIGASMYVVGAVDYRNWTGMSTTEPEQPPLKPTAEPANSPQKSPIPIVNAIYQTPVNQHAPTDSNVASNIDTKDKEPESTEEKPVIANSTIVESTSWLDQNWLIVLIIVLGGSAIWYFFVRPSEI